MINYKQARGVGFSIVHSALKVAPKTINVNEYVDNFIKTDKFARKVLRECGVLSKQGFQEGVKAAIAMRYGKEPEFFSTEFQAKEMIKHPERYKSYKREVDDEKL